MLRQPLEVEFAAARKAAVKAGLGTVTPELLHLGNHTTARLAPLPVVARIASGPSFDYSDGSLGREIRIGKGLADRGAPSACPIHTADPGPHFEAGCAITFWMLVEGAPVSTRFDERMSALALQRLHEALADLSSDFPSFMEKIISCESILTDTRAARQLAPGDRSFLRNVYQQVSADLKGLGAECRPIHGDAHVGNALMTSAGAVWMDLESVCLGPLEWDIAFLPEHTWPQFEHADTSLIRALADAHSLCVATWCWAEFDRTPATNEVALYHLAKLKRRFRSV